MKAALTVGMLVVSNVFMTLAWYGHLYAKQWGWFRHAGLWLVVLLSWGLAFFEYLFQVPANRLGHESTGGPFSLVQLKTLQEAVSLTVFTLMAVFVFRTERLNWNHLVGFGLLVLAVYFLFRKP